MRVVLALFLLLAAPSFSQSDAVLETEYDALLTIGENQYRSQDTARVENNHVVAVEFQEYKVELRISLLEADVFIVETSILERVKENWVRIGNDESRGFGGNIGSFYSFNWIVDDIRLGVAITVSIAN